MVWDKGRENKESNIFLIIFQKAIDISPKKCIILSVAAMRWHARVAELADAHV